MKRLFSLCIFCSILVSFDRDATKVLIYIQDGSMGLEYMLIHEVGKMSQILKQAGFEVTTATLSGELLKTDSVTIKPDLKLSEVNIDNYAGFIIPCMAVGDTIVTSEEIKFVKSTVSKGKPLAAQLGGVFILAKAGILNGKKYALIEDASMSSTFENGIYSGRGVIQDGNIITSGVCPAMAKERGYQDGTEMLTQTLIAAIKVKANNSR